MGVTNGKVKKQSLSFDKGKGRPQDPKATSKPKQQHHRSASVEDINDQDNFSRWNAGRPRDPNIILKSVDDDDEYQSPVEPVSRKKTTASRNPSRKAVPKVVEDENCLEEDADEAELGL